MKQEGDYLRIPISQIVASAKMRCRIEDGSEDIFLERYANEGARHFDSLSTFIKKECTLEVINGKAKLPVGFYQILEVDYSGPNGQGGSRALYSDLNFLKSCGVEVRDYHRNLYSTFQIQDGYIYLTAFANSNRNHGVSAVGIGPTTNNCDNNATNVQDGPIEIIRFIKIAYVSMNVDENNMMVVYADMERGLVAYCVWMYMLDSPAGRYTNAQIEMNHSMYVNQKKWYKSKEFQNNFRNNKRDIQSLARAYFVSNYTSI